MSGMDTQFRCSLRLLNVLFDVVTWPPSFLSTRLFRVPAFHSMSIGQFGSISEAWVPKELFIVMIASEADRLIQNAMHCLFGAVCVSNAKKSDAWEPNLLDGECAQLLSRWARFFF